MIADPVGAVGHHPVQLQLHLFGPRGQPRQRRLDRVHPLQGIAARRTRWPPRRW